MDNDRLHEKLDGIIADLHEVKITQAVNTQSLVEHMRRTEICEKRLEKVEDFTEAAKGGYKTFTVVAGLVGFLVTVSGFLAAAARWLK